MKIWPSTVLIRLEKGKYPNFNFFNFGRPRTNLYLQCEFRIFCEVVFTTLTGTWFVGKITFTGTHTQAFKKGNTASIREYQSLPGIPISTGDIDSFQSLSRVPFFSKTNPYRKSFLIPILVWNTNPNREYQSSSDIPIRSNSYRQHQSLSAMWIWSSLYYGYQRKKLLRWYRKKNEKNLDPPPPLDVR